MNDNKSKFLWLSPFNEVDMPLHKFILYVIFVVVGSLAIATILLTTVNLRIELWVWLYGTFYFYPLVIADFLVCAATLLVPLHGLSLTRRGYDVKSIGVNIKTGLMKPSYVQFFWISLVIAPLMAIILQHLTVLNEFVILPHCIDPSVLVLLSVMLVGLFLIGGYRRDDKYLLRFAPGTTDEDELGYSDAAIKDMERIINSKEHIIITNINGRLGEGKSSYSRMMVESQDQKDFLYTFISLTETNETKSFSKLFSERWAETIGSRYPSIVSSAKNSIIDHIFRESVSGVLKIAYSAMNVARWPVYRTRIVARGDNYPDVKYALPTIASLFAYVPHFNEKYWVVVIDEIERARFDEIYRTVETIERFKIESQWGLPIKLIFILCTDRIQFRERVNSSSIKSETAQLVYSFFETEPKAINMHIDLPPVSPDKKQAFIIKREKEWLIDRYKINVDAIAHPDSKTPADLNLYWLSDMINASDFEKGRLDDKKAHDWMLQYLLKESPRFIKKVLEETAGFLEIFTKSNRSPDQIRLSDLIMLHYLKFKYPEVLKFLYEIHPEVFPDFYAGPDAGRVNSLLRYFLRKKSDKEMNFKKYYEERTNRKLDTIEGATIEGIISFICYPVMQHIASLNKEDGNVSYEDAGKSNYDRTLGLPENMWDALTIATEKVQDTSAYLMTQRDELYTHQYKKLPNHLIRNGTKLLNFARNMRRFYPGDPVVSRYLSIRIARVLSKRGLIRRFPGSLGPETPYQNLLYVFTFHLTNYIGRDDVDPGYIDEAFGLLKEVLTSDETMLEGKLIIINALFIYAQGSKSGSIDLDRGRVVLETKYGLEIKKLISTVMSRGLDQYLPGTGKSIYDYEENYMYTLYQMWSGDPSDAEDIKKIRKVAAYGLAQHPVVIGHYWQNRFARSDNFVQNPELQVEIGTLIKATKEAGLESEYKDYIDHWTKDLNKKKEPVVPAGSNEGFSTVKMQLRKLGYIITTKLM